jgi:hypothetical protein
LIMYDILIERKNNPMFTIERKPFFSGIVDLDDKRFVGCKLTNCTLRYKGGQVEWDQDTTFINCRCEFLDAAERTIGVWDVARSGDLTNFHWANNSFSTH